MLYLLREKSVKKQVLEVIKLSNDTQLGTLIENNFGDKYLFSVNRKNFEQLDYQTQFNKEFNKTFEQKDTLYIITGTDSGMMVQQLLKTPPEKGSAYVFIDFPEVIELTKHLYNLSKHKRIIVSTEDQWEQEAKKIGLEIYFTINKVERIKSFAAQYSYINEYIFLRQTIEDTINHLIWQYQSQLGSKIFIQKQLENLAENHTPAIILENYFEGKAALILAGGPSLDHYIEWIEENQDHYVVIAVTRIARRLLETKIKPDIFVSVDPFPSNFNASKEVFNYEKECLLVHQYHLSPMLLGNWLGINLYLGDLFPWKTNLNQSNLTGIGPTVTNTAILLAIKMGIREQILFGVDLCYSPDGYTHALGSQEYEAGPDLNNIGQTVITNKGEKAETNSAYYEAKTTIEKLAILAKESGGSIYNPSPNSAKINYVKYISIDEIKINKEHISISKFLKKQLSQHKEHFYLKIKHYQNIIKELNAAQFKVNKIEELAKKGLEYNRNFFADDNPEANFKFKLKMDKLEKELNNKNLINFSELAKKFGINEFLYFLNTDTDREWSNEEIKKSGDIYYKAFKTGAIELGRQIFTAVNRTEARLLECNNLNINNNLIKRHLCSFNQSYLLERQIYNQVNRLDRINRKIEKTSFAQKQQQLVKLDYLKQTKNDTIKKCKDLYTTFKANEETIGINNKERLQSIAFYLIMLQNEENYQTRRIQILQNKNPELFFISHTINFLGASPLDYINRQNNINEKFLATKRLNKKSIIINQIKNLTENHTPVTVLKKLFSKESALILINEESINNHIEWLEKNQNNFVVITNSRISKYLLKTAIKPDFIIAKSSNINDFNVHKDTYHYEKNSILVHQNNLSQIFLGNWFGVNLFSGSLFPWESEIDIENLSSTVLDIDPASEDIVNMAVSFAHQTGIIRQIIFTDSYHSSFTKISKDVDNSGSTLLTPVKNKNKPDIVTQIKIDDIQIPETSIDIQELIKIKQLSTTFSSKNIVHYKNILKELIYIQDILIKMNTIVSNATETIQAHFSNTLQPNDEINQLEKKLNQSEYKHISKLLILFSGTPFLYFLQQNESEEHRLETYSEIRLFLSTLTNLRKQIFTAINRTEIRLLEQDQLILSDDVINRHIDSYDKTYLMDTLNSAQKKTILAQQNEKIKAYYHQDKLIGKTKIDRQNAMSFILLTEQYGRDTTTRRIYIFEQKNKSLFKYSENSAILGVKNKEIKEMHKASFENLISANDKVKLEGLEIKLYNLFNLKETKSIKQIIRGINLFGSIQPESEALLHLANGYYCELSNNIDQAIIEYGAADHPKTIESALKRLAAITLGQGNLQYAHEVLVLLSDISPTYLPQLAELYIISKNYKNALEIYTQYLEYNMSDVFILLKVANLYESQDITDGAQFIYKHILEIEPENSIALKATREIH